MDDVLPDKDRFAVVAILDGSYRVRYLDPEIGWRLFAECRNKDDAERIVAALQTAPSASGFSHELSPGLVEAELTKDGKIKW